MKPHKKKGTFFSDFATFMRWYLKKEYWDHKGMHLLSNCRLNGIIFLQQLKLHIIQCIKWSVTNAL
jgi:hypothetical protein